MNPTVDEIKVMIDDLNKAAVDVVLTPMTDNNGSPMKALDAMERAKLVRRTLFAGIDLVFSEILGLRSTLRLLLDHVDYTEGACRLNEQIGAILPKEAIALAKEKLA